MSGAGWWGWEDADQMRDEWVSFMLGAGISTQASELSPQVLHRPPQEVRLGGGWRLRSHLHRQHQVQRPMPSDGHTACPVGSPDPTGSSVEMQA